MQSNRFQNNFCEIVAHDVFPLDYLEDNKGWIHIVKNTLTSDEFITKPIYSPSPNRNKYKSQRTYGKTCPSGIYSTISENGDFILSRKNISKHYCSRSVYFDKSIIPKYRSDLIHLYEVFSSTGCQAFLFGSRLLNTYDSQSDWDVIIVGDLTIDSILKTAVSSSNKMLRFFTVDECDARAMRYGAGESHISTETLRRIFPKTTFYLKSKFGEIGIFSGNKNTFIGKNNVLSNTHKTTLTGKIIPSQGTSFSMPRIFKIIDENIGESSVTTTIWSLCGIERLSGVRCRISGAIPTDGNGKCFWLGGSSAKFSLA